VAPDRLAHRSEAPGSAVLAAAFITNLLLVREGFYAATLVAQLLFYGAAGGGYLLRNARRRIPLLIVPYVVCLLNWTIVVGLARFLTGRQTVTWTGRRRSDPNPDVNLAGCASALHPVESASVLASRGAFLRRIHAISPRVPGRSVNIGPGTRRAPFDARFEATPVERPAGTARGHRHGVKA